jgi:hypothetical protein
MPASHSSNTIHLLICLLLYNIEYDITPGGTERGSGHRIIMATHASPFDLLCFESNTLTIETLAY